jgi:hypothetical protein
VIVRTSAGWIGRSCESACRNLLVSLRSTLPSSSSRPRERQHRRRGGSGGEPRRRGQGSGHLVLRDSADSSSGLVEFRGPAAPADPSPPSVDEPHREAEDHDQAGMTARTTQSLDVIVRPRPLNGEGGRSPRRSSVVDLGRRRGADVGAEHAEHGQGTGDLGADDSTGPVPGAALGRRRCGGTVRGEGMVPARTVGRAGMGRKRLPRRLYQLLAALYRLLAFRGRWRTPRCAIICRGPARWTAHGRDDSAVWSAASWRLAEESR